MRGGVLSKLSLADGDAGQAGACAEQAADQASAEAASPDAGFAPPSLFDSFADECDRARTPAATGRLFVQAMRRLGFEHVALVTHGAPKQWASLSVFAHNWGEARAELLAPQREGAFNPIFQGAEAIAEAFAWSDPAFRGALDARGRSWLEEIERAGLMSGVTQRVRGAIVPASCSLAPAREAPIAIARAMRMAAYAFHHIIALQRPKLAQTDLLTQREHDCLSLATLEGLRPREVAAALGVRITTVRSMRQSACLRLGARSQEEAVWRMLETGQLFSRGRSGRPRSW
ncbi:MAG TPA: autoinducer binding domain-containing protein [Vitreimonas sp.]|uniref:helix-turn-helix transcriptional regulator n=1 Tax=Vitreimonas sp. TaxID=3069702 RepID=UPI002D63F3BF|nr:autoinducer binding domain-containing protein [Vitreimonas sp.]HYD86056.1 autoinducer binding domain-containing protein [Vitreimonas sp.]